MIGLLLLPAALAAPAGFELQAEVDGCRLYLGQAQADGVVPMRAECTWAGEDALRLAGVVARPEVHPEVWDQIAGSEVWVDEGEAQRLWFLHALPGFPDREVVVDWWVEDLDGGGVHTTWRTADVDFQAAPGHRRSQRFDGEWIVRPGPAGGAVVVHEVWYDPGPFPSWMVRPFLGRNLVRILADLRAYGRGQVAG